MRRRPRRRGAPPPASPMPCCARPGPLASGVWRFKELVLPTATAPVSHPEGNTPLLERRAVSAFGGVADLRLKHEGHNPTGSFKDRGMTVGVTQAVRVGATRGGVRLHRQHLGVAGGLRGAGRAHGARLRAARRQSRWASWRSRWPTARGRCWCGATSTTACGWWRRRSRELGVYLVNSINPFRLEGQKTIVLELLQQLGWEAPDWIVGAGRQPGQHGGVREGAGGGARARADRPHAAHRGGAGGGGGAVRAGFAEGFAHAARGEAGDGRDGDQHRRPRLLGPGGAHDDRHARRGARP